jgi:uncharacterized protein YigE (DUF2233 family)
MGRKTIYISLLIISIIGVLVFAQKENVTEDLFVSYIIDPKKQEVKFYLKDEKQNNFKSINNLKTWLEGKNEKLLFATNGGMYKTGNEPVGLFIENHKTITPLDTGNGNGNFYLKPNGVFYLTTDDTPVVCATKDFVDNGKIKYATQSGPMLLIDGKIHPAFLRGSQNVNIRNGVGVLPGNQVVFVMSKKEINFYDLANYFKSMGCKNALYLDGFVSRTYLPEKGWTQTNGDFGVIIGVIKSVK